jgi:ABC-type iron transport system FetAB permease component
MAIGYVIHLILRADRPAYVVLMVAAMLGFETATSARRARPSPGASCSRRWPSAAPRL